MNRHAQKIDRYAEQMGLTAPSTTKMKALIDEYIFSERDRYLISRYLLDDVPVGDYLLDEINAKFPYAPLEENGARKVIQRCIHRISKEA